jgi:hypothetical protein
MGGTGLEPVTPSCGWTKPSSPQTLNQCDILPLIQDVPLSQLQQATGLSLRYVSLIRRGERTPHPRHWRAFTKAVR